MKVQLIFDTKSTFKIQKERREQIDKICLAHGPELYHDNMTFQHFLIFIPQYNILFCGIPKAGTTTWVVGRIQNKWDIFNFDFQLSFLYSHPMLKDSGY